MMMNKEEKKYRVDDEGRAETGNYYFENVILPFSVYTTSPPNWQFEMVT